MEASEQSPEPESPQEPGVSIGTRLAAGREARGMTLEEVGQELRLSVATLEMLESDRFEELPEPIFVRGYVRSYARLLEMDDQAIVDEYERLVGSSEPELAPTSSIRRQTSPGDPFFRSATFLIIVAIAVLIGAWWFSRPEPLPEIQMADSGAEEAIVEQEPPPPALPENQPLARTLPATPEPPPVPEPVPEAPRADQPGPVIDPTPSDVGAGAPAEPPLPIIEQPTEPRMASAPAPGVGPQPEPEPEPEPAPPPASAATDAAPVAPALPVAPLASERGRMVTASRAPQGDDVLVLRAQAETWAEVIDANGYQLLYYLLRPGMERRLQGEAPFRVFLGNAPAVELSLNNEPFDHSNFHRPNRTARFTVDDAS